MWAGTPSSGTPQTGHGGYTGVAVKVRPPSSCFHWLASGGWVWLSACSGSRDFTTLSGPDLDAVYDQQTTFLQRHAPGRWLACAGKTSVATKGAARTFRSSGHSQLG